ncbi:MAG: T9SS type A sorting domain-containing protein [Bacteroidaceae bacterium]|nr:T9SS type A sorting domain-containing protein [Bacteroidaceae bacterium]
MKKLLLLVTTALMAGSSAVAQWNSNPAENMLAWPDNRSFYKNEMGKTSDGGVWVAINHPGDDRVCTSLQLIDSAGNYKFEEPLLVADYPSRTWTTTGQILFVDRDDNAIVAVRDERFNSGVNGSEESYIVYKISPEGEFLWGDGIALEGENVYNYVISMNMCQMSDGSYVFAWTHTYEVDASRNFALEMQRISAEGEMLWDPETVRLFDSKGNFQYPYVVDGGNNQVIMLYAKGTACDLYARKLDFDGTPVWSEDVRIYNGGWGNVPAWNLIEVHPSEDGGFIVTWNDDRYFTQIESAYMAYVKSNGELGFSTENGQILGLAGWRQLRVSSFYDKASDAFYALWSEFSAGQSWCRQVAQKINKEGELLWGENGVELKPMEQTKYSFNSIQSSVNDEIAFFYMRAYDPSGRNVESFVTTVNVNDTTIRREFEFTKGDRISPKSDLETLPLHDGKYWIVKWLDQGAETDEVNKDRLMIQRVNVDFTLGNPNADEAVEGVQADTDAFVALATLVENEAMFATNFATATQATLAIYDINGALVATPFDGVLAAGRQYIEWSANVPAGIYLATLTTANSVETVKLMVK